MIVFGLDAGFTAPGMVVVDVPDNWDLLRSKILDVHCVITTRDISDRRVSEDDAVRILLIVSEITRMVRRWSPKLALVELPMGGSRSAGAIKGMAFSTAMSVTSLALLEVPIVLMTPFEIKAAVTGDRFAEKDDMIVAVHRVWADIPWPKKVVRKKVTVHPDERKQEAIADALSTVVSYSSMKLRGKAPEPLKS